jgi:transposase
MLDSETRKIILTLSGKGHGIRAISRMLGHTRRAIRNVLERGTDEVPWCERAELGAPHLDLIRELHDSCKGNLIRVHEELEARGIVLAYSTLTATCRRHEIGVVPPTPKGSYEFGPGEEMQHDTSPHQVVIGGKSMLVQCAALSLCFSRMHFAQVYPRFNRFYCKVFLTDALREFEGAAATCMLDNSSVIIAYGTGASAVPAPEMAAFAEHFGFEFKAHEVGDANRSARVEGPFWYVERNFYPGRTFTDMADLNRQLADWCRDKSRRTIRTIGTRPIDLYETERRHLRPLPGFIPEVYRVHHRIVDLAGYVHLHTNRYSAPASFIGRRLELRETREHVLLFDGPRRICAHERRHEGARAQVTVPEHCPAGRRHPRKQHRPPVPEEAVLRAGAAELGAMLDAIAERHGRSVRRIRMLYRMYLEYPTDSLCAAIGDALAYGLTDLGRLERMTLRRIAGEYFQLSTTTDDEDEADDR